ncbi:ATP-grasp domain-containing protein [Phototrophicus methaneseepsis]|uniref:ATP-grasp domain-containing protein n=1 Tax=Phototrophicus methaneseepsis TaxID=2710758 RepID=A0A7S8E745_9CHLR|nr:ATP-grasp domain-containing protein [Phototrophicus methaneseepsis]QPC81606.1 ATP-grasp domain-containing protein [Phototrophicus methaneseepsis]
MTKTIGILGGGPLAKLTAQAAMQLGLNVRIFTTSDDDVACQAVPQTFVGSYTDEALLGVFAANCDVITVLDGRVPTATISNLMQSGKVVAPDASTHGWLSDRLEQRRHWQQARYDLPRFHRVSVGTDVLEAAQEFGFPVILKKRFADTDGLDRAWVRRAQDIEPVLTRWQGEPLLVDAPISGVRELAVTVVRAADGEIYTYPVVQVNRQHEQIFSVMCPAPIDEATAVHAVELARDLAEHMGTMGVLSVFMVELPQNLVMLSEVAYGPHPVANYTHEGIITSQAENHVRAVMGWPLGDVYQIAPATATVNVIDQMGTAALNLQDGLQTGGAHIHIYGYKSSYAGRILGHITTLGYEADGAEKVGRLALSRLLPTEE